MKRAVFRNPWLPYVLVAPQVAITLGFFFWPAFGSVRLSFYRASPFGDRLIFVGLGNFQRLFADAAYLRSAVTSVIFSFIVTLVGLAVKCQEVVHPSHQWVACGWRPKLTPHEEARMNVHKNARTTPQSRAEIVRRIVAEHQSTGQVAAAFGISARTVRKWVARAGSA